MDTTPTTITTTTTTTTTTNTSSDRCSICLSDIEEPTGTKQCNHIFCFNCIDSWVKNQDTCPLCKVKIKELLILFNGEKYKKEDIVVVEEPKKPSPDSVEVELACLDNRYFLEEVEKLLSISHSIVLQMEGLMSTQKKVYVTPSMSQQDTERLNSITDRLYSLQKDLENYENAFDPEDLLSTFYIFESTLNDLKFKYLSEFLNNNNINGNNRNRNNKKGKHIYNDDYDDDDDYYDQDEDTELSLYYNQIDNNGNSGGSNGRHSKLNSSNNNINNKPTSSKR